MAVPTSQKQTGKITVLTALLIILGGLALFGGTVYLTYRASNNPQPSVSTQTEAEKQVSRASRDQPVQNISPPPKSSSAKSSSPSGKLTKTIPEATPCANEKVYKSLEEALKNPKEVCLLNLRNSQLKTLPSEIGQLTKLVNLDISGNSLAELPPEIGNLVNLITLTAYTSKLTKLPKDIKYLTNLVNLVLYDNQLTQIPPEIGDLVNLSLLSLSNNQLTSLPEEIGKLTSLKIIYLTNNKFSQEEIKHIKGLLPKADIDF